jgi:Positive regulator of sigma E activity
MKQIVQISKKDNDEIKVTCDKSACEGCKGSFFCGSRKSEFEVENPEKLEVKEGDRIQIDIPARRSIFASFMSLGLPLIFFFVGLIIAYFINPANQIMQFIAGFIGLGLAFIISALFFKTYRKKYRPTVDKVLND